MLEIQKFLKNENGGKFTNETILSTLQGPPWFINIKRHPKYPNLVQFTYDSIKSPKDDPIVIECRGIILDENDNWGVVAFPFTRFFNEGEFQAATIDWSTARVQEKIDGSLIIMYYYDNEWQIATRGSPDASGPVGDFLWRNFAGTKQELTFKRLFWSSCEYWLKGLSKSGEFDPLCTYMWELTSPYNRIVCDYTIIGKVQLKDDDHNIVGEEVVDITGYAQDGSKITLIGARSNITLKEFNLNRYRNDVYYVVQEFPLTNLQEVIQAAAKLNPIKQEGFVVVDGNFNRIKIKSPQYVAIHHLRDGNPRKRLLQIIQTGENDELLAYKILDEFTQEKQMYLEMKDKTEKLILQTEEFYDRIKDIEIQKDFALEAVKSPVSGVLFSLRKGKIKSIREGILVYQVDKLLKLLDELW